jgi:16S rRNA (guanine966-N2)-methyltransferase
MVESSRDALDAIRTNVATLGVSERVTVAAGDVPRFVRGLRSASFGLVFADPPWALVDDGAAVDALAALLRTGAVAPGGWIVLEHASRTSPPTIRGEAELSAFDTRRYGDTALTFYKPDILVPLSL